MAACMPVMVVSRSCATCEIDTFMTVLSSTITNCETARMTITNQRFMAGAYGHPARAHARANPKRVRIAGSARLPRALAADEEAHRTDETHDAEGEHRDAQREGHPH